MNAGQEEFAGLGCSVDEFRQRLLAVRPEKPDDTGTAWGILRRMHRCPPTVRRLRTGTTWKSNGQTARQ